MKTINNVIESMLKECTGKHFLDSGDYYGRNWEKNQSINFSKIPMFSYDEHGYTLNVYPFLCAHLSITEKSKHFQDVYNELYAKSQDSHFQDVENFSQYLIKNNLCQSDNYITTQQGINEPINTYNGESALSQVLWYVIFYDGQDYFIILMIHNGCDVRGGYTSPKIFQCDAESFILNMNRCDVITKQVNNYMTDDTYHFYKDGSTKDGTFTWDDVYKEGIESII